MCKLIVIKPLFLFFVPASDNLRNAVVCETEREVVLLLLVHSRTSLSPNKEKVCFLIRSEEGSSLKSGGAGRPGDVSSSVLSERYGGSDM